MPDHFSVNFDLLEKQLPYTYSRMMQDLDIAYVYHHASLMQGNNS